MHTKISSWLCLCTMNAHHAQAMEQTQNFWNIIKHIITREEFQMHVMQSIPISSYSQANGGENSNWKTICQHGLIFIKNNTTRYILFNIWVICFKTTRYTGASMSNKSKLFINRKSISHLRMKKTRSVRVVQHSRTLLRGWRANCEIKLLLYYSNSNCSAKWNWRCI